MAASRTTLLRAARHGAANAGAGAIVRQGLGAAGARAR